MVQISYDNKKLATVNNKRTRNLLKNGSYVKYV